jgi:phosphatidylserine/phosphatidylglycerophosphate/cardiolipin synthase-like enzyme
MARRRIRSITFLPTPFEIRGAIGALATEAPRLDLAVAFVGQDWLDAIAGFRGPLRIICWLSSTNTDPQAVEQLMRRPRTEVRQRDSMHAKVYSAPGVGAVIGSANLSRRALAAVEGSGRDEAAVQIFDSVIRGGVEAWFRRLWQDAPHSGARSIQRSTCR